MNKNELPIHIQNYMDELPELHGDINEAKEVKAYQAMLRDIENETDPSVKLFMRSLLETSFGDGRSEAATGCKFTYFLENLWSDEIKRYRKDISKVRKNAYPLTLVADIEDCLSHVIDSSRYTKQFNSYEGRFSPRYPLTIVKADGSKFRIQNHFTFSNNFSEAKAEPEDIYKSYYALGSHRFHAGYAIQDILNLLEKRYFLNFKQLEKEYQKKCRKRNDS